MKQLKKWLALALAACTAFSLTACEVDSYLDEAVYADAFAKFFVAPNGSDQNDGSFYHPFATPARAAEAARECSAQMDGEIQILLRGGEYLLTETLALDEADSGQNGYDIVWSAYNGEEVVLSGGQEVTGWTLFDAEKNIYAAAAAAPVETRQLYVNGKRAVRARSEGGLSDATYDDTGHTTTDTYLAEYKNISDLEMVYKQDWTNPRCGVESVSVSGGVAAIVMKQPGWTWCRNKGGTSATTPWYYENAYELLDAEGEWYLDRTGAIGGEAYTFYYKPLEGEDMSAARVVVPVLEELLTIQGSDIDHPVSHIRFEGLAFRHATWTRPNGSDGHADVQNNVLREDYDPENPAYTMDDYKYTDKMTGGCIVLRTADSVTFRGCEFSALGNTAIYMYKGAKNNLIEGCAFFDLSAGAVQIGEVDMYDDTNWKDDDERYVLRNNDILHNYMHDVAVEYRSAAAVGLGYVIDSDVLYNEIANLPYSGVHLGWGWKRMRQLGISCTRNNRIEYNYIHDLMTVLRDGGGIYALGAHSPDGNTVIAHNFIQRQMNVFAAIYLDEACDYYSVYENVIDTAPQWVCSKHVQNDIHDNYTNQAAYINDPDPEGTEKAVIRNTCLITDGNWGEAAEAIMQNTGPQGAYRAMLPVSGEVVFDASAIDAGSLSVTVRGVRNLENADTPGLFFDGDADYAGKTITVNRESSLTADSNGSARLPLTGGTEALSSRSGGITFELSADFVKGRSRITVGLCDAAGQPLFSDGIDLIAGYADILIEDYENAEIGAAPQGICFDPELGSVTVAADPDGSGNRVLKVSHTGQTPDASFLAAYEIPATAGILSVSMKVKATAKNAALYVPYIRSGTTEIVTINLHNNGYVAVNRPPVEYYGAYQTDVWIEIKVVLDTAAGSFDLYVDGVRQCSGVPLRAETETVDNICVGMYRYDTGSYYIDDLVIKAIPE